MKAYITHSYDANAKLELADIPTPELAPGHVLIQVKATSLNPIDNKFLRAELGFNPQLPAVLHGDVAGVVAKVGDGVTDFVEGDEVYGCAGGFKNCGGALAEFMLANADFLAKKPQAMSFGDAAALPLVSVTAWEALKGMAGIEAGQHVLIHAGVGGVGHVAIQLAKIWGARVATTVSSDEKAAIAKELGADDIINYRNESVEDYVARLTEGEGFDIVFDTVGGDNLELSIQAAKLRGKVANILGYATLEVALAFKKGVSIFFENMTIPLISGKGRAGQGAIMREVTKFCEEGKLAPYINPQRFSFDEVNEAHALFESNKHVGKIVLTSPWN